MHHPRQHQFNNNRNNNNNNNRNNNNNHNNNNTNYRKNNGQTHNQIPETLERPVAKGAGERGNSGYDCRRSLVGGVKPDYNHVINSLQDYMLNGKLLAQSIKHKSFLLPDKKKEMVVVKPIPKVLDKFFYPEQKDSLYWCYFIIKNGFAKYEYPNVTSFVNEKIDKFKSIELLRINKQQLKLKKIKNLKEDVEDELANKERIGMKTFIALCVADNINILFIHKRKCFEIIFDEQEDAPIHVVHQIDSPTLRYSYETIVSKDQIKKYRTEYFKWESVDKPLKAISSYKSEELVDLCKKLDISAVALDNSSLKKKTKKDLYELLIMNI
jgi:hypothetical protein